MTNLAMPGNPRTQPHDLREYFGYDNLMSTHVEVELAVLDQIYAIGMIPYEDFQLLTPDLRNELLAITTTEVDTEERTVTKHDVRALVNCMKRIMPLPLHRWIHVPLTSYDVIDTARILMYVRAYRNVVQPKMIEVIKHVRRKADRYLGVVQIGRTHGQHALPITLGFWLATILNRLVFNASEMDRFVQGLVGKISGAVGAYNAQEALLGSSAEDFEIIVLQRLGLEPAPISTQILPPEPLTYFLFSVFATSATIGQFGRDARNLMRSEIGELREPFAKGQVGSSTMAHKRNPINFENMEGTLIKSIGEFLKVMLTLTSEHQRDLVGSTVSRDFPTLVINLVEQLDRLLRQNKEGRSFIDLVSPDVDACARNVAAAGDFILAEPLYLALQMAGYPGDAHEVVNHRAMPLAGSEGLSLVAALEKLVLDDEDLRDAWENIPPDTRALFQNPASYVGRAAEKVQEICELARHYIAGTDSLT